MENNEPEIIVGLDIGTTKIACIVGKKDEYGKIEIMGYGKTESLGVKRGVVANIENTVNSIKKAVKIASEQSEVEIHSVHVGIAGQHIRSMQHRGNIIREDPDKPISQHEINKLIRDMYKLNMAPGEEILDVIPQDFIIDNEEGIREPRGMLGSTLEANFHIIVGQTAAAKNIYTCVKKAGLEVEALILEPIASAQAVLSEEEREAGVALVDIGGGTTDIAIFQDHIIRHTAVIPFGGEIITEDVREGCSIIRRYAEQLKVKFGSALADQNSDNEVVAIPSLRGRPPKEITLKNLANIIQARLEEILEQVDYEIKNSKFKKKLIGGIVLTGGGSQLKHIDQLAQFITGMDTRIGYPNEHLSLNNEDEIAAPIFATGVGLVIEGIKRNELKKELNREKENGENEKSKKTQGGWFSRKRTRETEMDRSATFLDKLKTWFENDTVK